MPATSGTRTRRTGYGPNDGPTSVASADGRGPSRHPVLIDYLRGREGARDRLRTVRERGDDAYVCAISVEEVARGLHPREDDALIELLDGLRVAPLRVAEGRLAGYWRRSHSRRGRTLTQSDALVAAASVGVGARLATGNPKDFPMRGVEVEHWSVGE